MDNQRGFTIMELAVTLMLIALISSFAIASYRQQQLSAKTREARACVMQSVLAEQRFNALMSTVSPFQWPACVSQLGTWYQFNRTVSAGQVEFTAVPRLAAIAALRCSQVKAKMDGELVMTPADARNCRT